jgi:tetratricopeptide (TPR) repeat protein
MTMISKFGLMIAVACGVAWPANEVRASGGAPSVPAPAVRGAEQDRESTRARPPQKLATAAYNKGYAQIKKADRYGRDAATATDEGKKYRAQTRSRDYYTAALGEFGTAVSHQSKMHEAWNYIGYAERHLGNYAAALEAYDQALALEPDYAEAVEYRGEAYLGLDRLDDARTAYLDLFANSRPLAAQLLAAMQAYVAARRETPNGLDPQALETFARWVEERTTIAQQTVSLDPGAAAPAWR